MFYSHEVLTSRKYGFATVWLVATLGSNTKKVSRKAILDVDISKTCETIAEPSVPLALRLQSNLLFGVAQVYTQKCSYVLTDVESARVQLRTMSKVINTSALLKENVAQGNTRLMLGDDPSFLPELGFDTIDLDKPFDERQFSNLVLAAPSPLPALSQAQDSSRLSFGDDLVLHDSPGQGISGLLKSIRKPQEKPQFEGLQEDLGLVLEEDGDIVMHGTPAYNDRSLTTAHDDGIVNAGLDDIPMPNDDYPVANLDQEQTESAPAADHQLEVTSETASAHLRPSRPRRRVVPLDETIEISSSTLRAWQDNYLSNMQRDHKSKGNALSQALSKGNASFWMTHSQPLHPALSGFTNAQLISTYMRSLAPPPDPEPMQIDKVAPQAPESEQLQDTYMPAFDEIEYGRAQATPLDDHRHSSMLPWSGAAFQQPASSHTAQSYLGGRARLSSLLPRDVRAASIASQIMPEFSAGMLQDDGTGPQGPDQPDVRPSTDSQMTTTMLNESVNFLAFVEDAIEQRGGVSNSVTLSNLLPPKDNSSAVAAQAFLHVLGLGTQNVLKVVQQQAFGDITLSVK